jgi:DNA end-binding protein Ku
MVEAWEPEKYKDRYRDDLLGRIREKIEAGQTEATVTAEVEEEVAAGSDVLDIMDLLKRSVERAGKGEETADEETEAKASTKKAATGRKGSGRGRKTA